jgi:tRNA modification GTPase
VKTPSYGSYDPIAALATPSGESALALLRLSGGGSKDLNDNETGTAITLLSKLFSKPEKLLNAPGNSSVHGWIKEKELIDEVIVSVYRAPKSYTGEDAVDISCHGGTAVVKKIMAALKQAGFREALPGEFTFRAFMNGKLDLTRCESVMELVQAKSDKARGQAVRRLSGALEAEITAIKNLLIQTLAEAEIYLDYSEDEVSLPEASGEKEGLLPGRPRAEEALSRLRRLADCWCRERLYAEGALVVLAGRPNAGKSSLFNYLLKEDRSIVTNIPGTTRDWIEAALSLEGIPVRLADTAGLRETASGALGEVERIGIEKSRELVETADLVLYVIDGEAGITKDDIDFIQAGRTDSRKAPRIVLWNKADLSPKPELPQDGKALFPVSAKTGEGIGGLCRLIAETLEEAAGGNPTEAGDLKDSAGPGTERQKELIDAAIDSVEEALELSELDIIAPPLRDAVNCLGEITGEFTTADLLETMFSKFCVGK